MNKTIDLGLKPEEVTKKKAEMCSEEISKILEKYEMSIKPILVTTSEGIFPNVVLVDKQKAETASGDEEATPVNS